MEVDEPHDVLTLGSDRPSTWWRIVLALLVAAVIAFSGYRLLTDGATDAAKAEPPSGQLDAPLAASGPTVQRPSGQRSPVVYAVGRTVHAATGDVLVHGPGVGAGTVVRVRGPANSGWLVSLEQSRSPEREGIVDAAGLFHPWGIDGFAGTGRAIMSPDGAEVLGLMRGRTWVVDAASGTTWEQLPRGRAVGWNDAGVHLLRGGRTTARIWERGAGMTGRTFDATACAGDLTAVTAAIDAGWRRCLSPGLVAVSPSGGTLLAVRSPVGVSLTTQAGRRLTTHVQDGTPGVQRLEGAAFVNDELVVLSLTERTREGAVSAFVSCSVTTAACQRVTDPVPAGQAPGAAFLVAPPCNHEGGGRGGAGGEL